VRDGTNSLVAALNILAYRSTPLGPEWQTEVATYLRAKAFFISKQLGYTGYLK
jgi:hypothetical protein